MDRIAPEMIRRLYGSARHPDYVNSPMIFVSRSAEAEQQLRQGTHVFQLGRAVTARGVVVDAGDRRVAEAKVLVGSIGDSGRRESVTGPDGTFVVTGCKPGKNLLTASAAGYAATTLSVDMAAESPPFTLVLQAGKILRLRVVNKESQAVAGASIWLNTFRHGPVSSTQAMPEPVQAECCPKTDADGRMVWENAPDADLTFDVYSRGSMRVSDFKVRPDGAEHVVTMPPALTVLGTVSDAQTGESIPRFRMGTGWPSPTFIGGVLTNSVQWSTIDRFWITFSGGEFKHTYEEAVIGGTTNLGYVFKFEAEGYAPFVTRTVAADEGEARFTVKLEKAASTTISVRKPGGQPAIAVDVGLASANTGLMITPGGFDHSETTTLTLGASSYTVSARLRWPAGMARAADGRVMGSLSTPMPQPPFELLNNPELLRQWWQRPEMQAEMQALARSARQFSFHENADGTYTADDVEPGTYSVRVGVLRPAVEGLPPVIVAQAESSVTVPSEPASGTLDLGELLLRPAPAP